MMFRAEVNFNPQTKKVNFLFMNGGVGDHIAALTAIKYVNSKYPWITSLLWLPDFLVELAQHLLPGIQVYGYSQMKGKYDPSKATKTTQWDGFTSPMKIHLLDYAFLKLCDENPSIEHKNYLQIRSNELPNSHVLPSKYVVITSGFTAKVREFPAKQINIIAKYLNNKGYKPVFLGQTDTKTGAIYNIKGNFDETIDFNMGINLIDKTNLLQAANIISKSIAVIGVDNGLLHLAGCTHVPIVAGFTTVSPNIRLPIRNNKIGWRCYSVVPDASLGCSFCQEKTNFIFNHDYKKCIYKDNKCTEQMTAEKFIVHLESILQSSFIP